MELVIQKHLLSLILKKEFSDNVKKVWTLSRFSSTLRQKLRYGRNKPFRT